MIAATARCPAIGRLPGRPEAEVLIDQLAKRGPGACVVAITVDYYHLIVDAFGLRSGEKVLGRVLEHLPAGRLFRWTGSTLVAVLDSVEQARAWLSLVPPRMAARLPADNQSVLIPFSVRGKVFRREASEPARRFKREIDHWLVVPWADACAHKSGSYAAAF